MSDSQDGAAGCKHISGTNLRQTTRLLFIAFALEVSGNEAGFVAVPHFTISL